jgi:hypothetical protein
MVLLEDRVEANAESAQNEHTADEDSSLNTLRLS